MAAPTNTPTSGPAGSPSGASSSGRYEIHVRGHLADRWVEEFPGFQLLRDPDGTTRLTGPVADQAALHGLLRRVRDLGWPLLGVVRVHDDAPRSARGPSDRPLGAEASVEPEASEAEEGRP